MGGFDDREPWRVRVARGLAVLFPERQILLRTEGRVAHLRLPRRLQIAAFSFLLMLGAWGIFASVSYVIHDQVLVSKENQIANARLAYRSLLGEVVEYQRKFNSITRDLEENHGLMLGLVEQNASLQKSLTNVEKQLRYTEKEREQIVAARERLKGQLAEIEDSMHSLASNNFALKGNLDTVEADLQSALSERNRVQFESDRMRRHINELEGRLVDLQETQKDAVRRLTERTVSYIDSMEKVLQIAGLDVDQVVAADQRPRKGKGQGGPFIAAGTDRRAGDDLPGGRLKSELASLEQQLLRWEAVQGVMQKMPLVAPLNAYAINSSFGKRRDPINGKWSAHYGLDLGAALKSPVLATAPGVVAFAGYQSQYGRVVEIAHGAGITTRFAHLDKLLVKKGDKVAFQQTIALLGNSGRSTGAHLHYEIHFRGKPKNPMNFIKAGRHVFKE